MPIPSIDCPYFLTFVISDINVEGYCYLFRVNGNLLDSDDSSVPVVFEALVLARSTIRIEPSISLVETYSLCQKPSISLVDTADIESFQLRF